MSQCIRKYGISLLILWTLIIGAITAISLYQDSQNEITSAINEARDYYRLNLHYRSWAARLGGVYAPADKVTPNPYLTVPRRDVTTSDGQQLTLVNPAYMTRMVFETIRKDSSLPVISKLTSIKPLNPVNAPSEWERQALEGFDRKEFAELSRITTINGNDYLQFIARFVTDAPCLKCHAQQGYQEGDIRGGISIAVPLAPYQLIGNEHNHRTIASFVALWGIGGIGIAGFSRRRFRHEQNIIAARDELLAANQKLAIVADGIPAMIAHVGDDERYLYVNRAYADWAGRPAAQIVGATVREVIGDATYSESRPYIQQALAGKQGLLERITHQDGTTRKQLINFFPQKATNGTTPAYFAIITDITEREQLQDKVNQLQKLEAIGRLAGGVAHDINNKLTVILGFGELLRLKANLEDDCKHCLEEIIKAGEQSRDITRQLLAFSRSQAISPQVIDLNAFLTNARKVLSRLIGEDIHLTLDPEEKLAKICIDPAQLDQIVMNLVLNARDALLGGGSITIRTDNVAISRQQADCYANATPGDYVLLSISDTGCGMTAETIAHIFEPFYTTKEVGKGTGLGLATIFGIVTQNQGFIHVESTLHQGSTFFVYLPRADVHAQRTDVEHQSFPPAGNGTILLVEDEATVRQVTTAMLEKIGYRVIVSQDIHHALNVLNDTEVRIDCLVTDVIMPEMSGKELSLAAANIRPGLPVLFISGYPAEVIGKHGILEPDINLLQKPFDVTQLGTKLQDMLTQGTVTSHS